MSYAAFYLIATGGFEEDVEQEYWDSDIREWNVLECATVYTDIDRNSGVRLPRGGYWLRISPEGITKPSHHMGVKL